MCPRSSFSFAPINNTKVRGLGLPLAIFIITVMAFIALAINELSEAGAKTVGVNVLSMRAFYAAESGANVVLAAGGSGPPCNSSTTVNINSGNMQAGLAQCRATVTCTPNGTVYDITSTGICGSGAEQATRIVRVRLE
jgi:MSHA biogenesis protein MshP